MSEKNNTQIDKANSVIPVYNLIECSNNIWKHLQVYCIAIDEPSLNNAGAIIDFPDNNNDNNDSVLFKFKSKITGKIVSLKYLSNFWRIFEMPLINCN